MALVSFFRFWETGTDFFQFIEQFFFDDVFDFGVMASRRHWQLANKLKEAMPYLVVQRHDRERASGDPRRTSGQAWNCWPTRVCGHGSFGMLVGLTQGSH